MSAQWKTASQGQALLDPDRFFAPDPGQRRVARQLYDAIADLPIVCPHGHVDPRLLADENATFGTPAGLLCRLTAGSRRTPRCRGTASRLPPAGDREGATGED